MMNVLRAGKSSRSKSISAQDGPKEKKGGAKSESKGKDTMVEHFSLKEKITSLQQHSDISEHKLISAERKLKVSNSSNALHTKDKDTTTDIKGTAENEANQSSAVAGSEEPTAHKKQTTISKQPDIDEENLIASEDIEWVENNIDFDKKCQSNREVIAIRPFLEEEKLNEPQQLNTPLETPNGSSKLDFVFDVPDFKTGDIVHMKLSKSLKKKQENHPKTIEK